MPSGNVTVAQGGANSDQAIFMQLLGLLGVFSGPGIYKSPLQFTAVQNAATEIVFSGGYPSIVDISQFIVVVQISTAGVVTYHFPSLSTGAFSWNASTGVLTVANAVFDPTDIFGVVISGPDRYANDPGNFEYSGIVNPFQLTGDDTSIFLISAAQNFTASFVDIGPELSLFGKNKVKTLWKVIINDSTGLQFRLLEKGASAAIEEYPPQVETYGTSDVKIEDGYHERTSNVDALFPIVFHLDGSTPYGQLQIKAGVLGGGTDAQVDSLAYVRSAFGG